MKYYFDQRDSKNVNVFIYVDDEYYGKIYANEACVTSVELLDDQSGAFLEDDSDESEVTETETEETKDPDLLESVAYQDMHFGYEDFVKIPYDGMSNRRWQFPYDVEIDISAYSEDLTFYPAAFERREVDGGIYYQGRTVENCNLLEL